MQTNWYNKLKNLFMIDCQEATELMNKAEYEKLCMPKKLRLHLHLALCPDCRAYNQQNKFISAMFSSWKSSCLQQSYKSLCPHRKAAIQQQIEAELRKKDK